MTDQVLDDDDDLGADEFTDGTQKINVEEDEGKGDEKLDRGDEVDPKLDPEALKALAGEEDEEGEEADDAGSKTVPHSRFHAVNEAKKAAEAQNAELLRQLAELQKGSAAESPPPAKKDEPEFDLAAKQAEFAEATSVMDNETATRLFSEINAYILKQAEDRAFARMEASFSENETKRQVTEVVKDAYKRFPFLDPKSDDANAEAIDDVVGWREVFRQRGDSVAVALAKAVEKVAPGYGEPNTDGKPAATIAHLAKARQADAVKRGADASSRQPPSMRGVGEREANLKQLDIERMTEEEFEKLPLAEKKRARGD